MKDLLNWIDANAARLLAGLTTAGTAAYAVAIVNGWIAPVWVVAALAGLAALPTITYGHSVKAQAARTARLQRAERAKIGRGK